MPRQITEISWTTLWRILAMAVFVGALYLMKEALAIVLLALVISTALHPPVAYLERWKIPRILGTILLFLTVFVILAFIVYALLPVVILELNSLVRDLSDLTSRFLGFEAPANLINLITPNLDNLTNILLAGSVPFLEVLGRLVGGVTFVLAVLVLSFYLTVSREGVERFLRAVFPAAMEERVLQLYGRTKSKIGRWFQAQVVLSLVIGVAVFIGLRLLGVEQALVLSVIAGLFELVPIAGPIFAGALAIVVAATQSLALAFWVLIFFVALQQLEGNLLVPIIMKKAIGVHPVIILVALLGGAEIAGVVGMLLAVPAAVFLQEMTEDWKADRRAV
ncbi:MAG: AI-2E family transporter [Candidatus Colwellbacteria bacterium]|nr:AI-2E family transporter [Candidatus Colwellbacteria bacterium]